MKQSLPGIAAIAASLALYISPCSAQNQYYINSELLQTLSAAEVTLPFVLPGQNGVDYYKITYNTVDLQGQPTVASGAVAVPKSTSCDVYGMVMYCHGTVLRKQDVPSGNNLESQIPKVLAGQGMIVCAPDYLGLGVNPGLHPYVHAESQATASIDMYFATREFVETLGDINHNGELFITGYSQGGHASMATLKYAQDNGLMEEMGIVAGAPLSGPYNMSGSQAEVLLSGEPYSNPGYVVYLLKSYQMAYGNLYTNLSDILQSPYDELVLPYFDGMQNEFDMAVVNELLPNSLPDLMVDTVLANMALNDNHPIWQALRDNDNYDWAPQVPLRLYYCEGDEQVPFENSVIARDSMVAKGSNVQAFNLGSSLSHGQCVIPAILGTQAYFAELASPCGTLASTDNNAKLEQLEAWPNPVRDELYLRFPSGKGQLRIYDAYGKLVHQAAVQSTASRVDVSGLAGGMYIAVYENDRIRQRATVIVE